jgi:RimJ/RimL family protein N-acetyltransferase
VRRPIDGTTSDFVRGADVDDGGKPNFWRGTLVRLRAFEPTDWETYFSWNHDTDQARSVDAIWFPQSPNEVRGWAEREATRERTGDNFRFVVESVAGEAVGDLTTHHSNPRVGTFAYGITIRAEHRRRGYATEAIRLVLAYYFGELRYQKVTVSVHSYNEPSVRLHERLGFRQEGRLRRTVYTRGQYFDELLFGLTAEEFLAGVDAPRER